MRDVNWGIYQGKSALRAWAYYKNPKLRFKKAPPKGESWDEVRDRMLSIFKELEQKYNGKNILIISHGDPLWLLEGWIKGRSENQLLKQKFTGKMIKTGEVRKLQ